MGTCVGVFVYLCVCVYLGYIFCHSGEIIQL